MLAYLAPTEACRRYMSVFGISTWADHDRDGEDDADVLADCQKGATVFLVSRFRRRYLPEALYADGEPANADLQEAAVVIALRRLCLRRGNPVPASLEDAYQELVAKDGWIDQVVSGKTPLVDGDGELLARRPGIGVPSWSNLRVDRRYPSERVRVDQQSSDTRPTALERDSLEVAAHG